MIRLLGADVCRSFSQSSFLKKPLFLSLFLFLFYFFVGGDAPIAAQTSDGSLAVFEIKTTIIKVVTQDVQYTNTSQKKVVLGEPLKLSIKVNNGALVVKLVAFEQDPGVFLLVAQSELWKQGIDNAQKKTHKVSASSETVEFNESITFYPLGGVEKVGKNLTEADQKRSIIIIEVKILPYVETMDVAVPK